MKGEPMTGRMTLFSALAGASLLLSAPTIHAQDNGDPGGDPANPLWNGMGPSQCRIQSWDAPSNPNGRSTYNCDYPNGTAAFWLSDTDSTLLAWNTGCDIKRCTGTYQETAAGHAYLDGPAPSQPEAGSAQTAVLALKGFPGAVLLLPIDQSPYASWSFGGVRVDSGPSYLEYVGEMQGIGSDVLSIQASVGPPGYDPRSDLKPACQPATPYCYFPPFGQSSGAEIFNGLKARGNDAFVFHKTFPSETWSLSWFDTVSNTNYTLSFGGDDVISMFEPLGTFSNSNVTGAQKLAAMADNLIPWTAN
jgi:hypothetical protein